MGDRRFHIVGAGGHGKVVADAIRAAGGRVTGFVDRDADKLGSPVGAGNPDADPAVVSVLQDELFELVSHGRRPHGWDALALGIGDNAVRLDILAQFEPAETPAIVHPSAAVSPSAQLGPATVVFGGAVINADARVGAGVIVNSAAVIEHDCTIGDGVHISPNAAICGEASVGPRSWVGAGSTVIQQVSVGADAVVGAGAVVIDDVASERTVVGNPARPITS